MSAFYGPVIDRVLTRLYAEAKQNDHDRSLEEQALATAHGGLDEPALTSLRNRSFMAVAPEVGKLFYLLVRTRRPRRIVEFGTSFGISTIHLAAALRDNGSGHIITTEQSSAKAARAAQHFAQAGLADRVELRQGDAFASLQGVGDIDMLVLDGWKPLYLPLLRQLEPALSPSCLIVADDVIGLANQMEPYLHYVRDAANGYVSSEIPMDDGVELSIR